MYFKHFNREPLALPQVSWGVFHNPKTPGILRFKVPVVLFPQIEHCLEVNGIASVG